MESGSGFQSPETDIQKLQRENDELRAGKGVTDEPETEAQKLQRENDELRAQVAGGENAAVVVGPPVAPLDALKKAMDANPEGTFMEHLKVLAEDGIKAVINPADEHDALRVLAALVSDVVKVVKP